MKKDLSNLRMIKKGVKLYARENFDEDAEVLNENLDGVGGKGRLCRKYIDDLDMEFYAFRSKESKNDHPYPLTIRLPDSLLSDISQMVESSRTPYRTKSEFIRSSVFILANYWAHKFPKLGKRYIVQTGIELCEKVRKDKESRDRYVQIFKEALPVALEMSDGELDLFLKYHDHCIRTQYDDNHKYVLLRQFETALIESGVQNPWNYFQIKEGREDEDE